MYRRELTQEFGELFSAFVRSGVNESPRRFHQIAIMARHHAEYSQAAQSVSLLARDECFRTPDFHVAAIGFGQPVRLPEQAQYRPSQGGLTAFGVRDLGVRRNCEDGRGVQCSDYFNFISCMTIPQSGTSEAALGLLCWRPPRQRRPQPAHHHVQLGAGLVQDISSCLL